MTQCVRQLALGTMAGVLVGSAAAAADIYKWVTPDGVTHYSEIPPAAELASLETIEVESVEPADAAAGDYRSVLEVANSIEASRLQRERLRMEKRQRRAEQQRPVATPQDSGATATWIYYPPFRRYPPYRGYPPYQHHPRPVPYPDSHGRPRSEQAHRPQRERYPRLMAPDARPHPSAPNYNRPGSMTLATPHQRPAPPAYNRR